jgi:hypothetical protein
MDKYQALLSVGRKALIGIGFEKQAGDDQFVAAFLLRLKAKEGIEKTALDWDQIKKSLTGLATSLKIPEKWHRPLGYAIPGLALGGLFGGLGGGRRGAALGALAGGLGGGYLGHEYGGDINKWIGSLFKKPVVEKKPPAAGEQQKKQQFSKGPHSDSPVSAVTSAGKTTVPLEQPTGIGRSPEVIKNVLRQPAKVISLEDRPKYFEQVDPSALKEYRPKLKYQTAGNQDILNRLADQYKSSVDRLESLLQFADTPEEKNNINMLINKATLNYQRMAKLYGTLQ